MLAEHPDVLRRLREEILTKVGSDRRPTYEDIKDMRYLRAVINGSFVIILFFVEPLSGRLIFFSILFRNSQTLPGCVSYYYYFFASRFYFVF